MAISIFPSTAAEFVSNNFVVDMNDTSNNTADTGGVKQAGPYSISFSSGDSSFDVYFVDEDGNSVGYSNTTSIVASGLFSTVVIFGVAQDEVVSFLYQGSVNNADGEGDEPGAGAYLESISPSDLPSIDDTATVTGGNFASDVEITFESGATVLPAKNIVVTNSTSLVVTRPDGLIEDDSPYDLKAINPGVTPPTGTDAHILVDGVTAGSDPTWVTTSPLNTAIVGEAFSQTLSATDEDSVSYTITSGSLATGLSLNSSTGEISGTATEGGNFTFTVKAADPVGNTTDRQFEQIVSFGASGGQEFSDGGFRYHLFTSTDDLEIQKSTLQVEYLVVAGGGGGGLNDTFRGAGGGGAGGLLNASQTLSLGTFTCTVGAGGASQTSGSNSSMQGIVTATGGGFGADQSGQGGNGGSGGGGGAGSNFQNDRDGGSGISGQGFAGGNGGEDGAGNQNSGGGGGASEQGDSAFASPPSGGGDGSNFSTFANAVSLVFDGGFFAGGGGGNNGQNGESNGTGGAGGGANAFGTGEANSGGGGGGGQGPGGSGVIIVRYAI